MVIHEQFRVGVSSFSPTLLFLERLVIKCMDVKTLSDIANSPAVWAICCIALVGFILKKIYEKNDKQEERLTNLHDEYMAESKERENKLMEHLTRSDELHERQTSAIEGINKSLQSLEVRVDNIERNSYRKYIKRDDLIENQLESTSL